MRKLGKKGFQLADMSGIAIAFVIIAVVLGLGGTVLATIQADQTADSVAYNATGNGLTSIGTMSSYLPTIAVVVVLAVIVGIIVSYLAVRAR